MIEPMLAVLYDEDKVAHRDACEWWLQERKYNGMRATMVLRPDGKHRLFSRIVSTISYSITEKTNHLLWLPDVRVDRNVLLDGELHLGAHSKPWLVMEIMGSATPEAIARQAMGEEVWFTPFDLLHLGDHCYMEHDGQRFRTDELDRVMQDGLVQNALLDYVERNEGDVWEFFDRVVEDGGEGVMIKNPYSLYLPGKRPANTWIKLKPVLTFYGVVMFEQPGRGKHEQRMGSLEVGLVTTQGVVKRICSVGTGFTDAEREQPVDWWVNKVIKVAYTDQTHTGTPQHPRFVELADDVGLDQCQWRQLDGR